MKKLKESVHAIQVGCQICEGPHLDKDFPHNEEVKQVEEASIDVINEILEENFDALLDEESKILHFIKGTLLKEEMFFKFNEYMEMTVDGNSESEYDTEEPPCEKITINTNYKIKTPLKEPPTDLELKPIPNNLEYVFLEEPSFLPVIISSELSTQNKSKLVYVLKNIRKPSLGKR
nr:reverse transcriptase domain-containing protein [Tanacetum cinerariifolium]